MSLTIRRFWFNLDRHDDPAPAGTGTGTGTVTDPGSAADDGAGGKPADDPGKKPTFTGDFDKDRAERALAAAREAERAAKAAAQQANEQLAGVLKALGKAPDGSDLPQDPQQLAAELTEQAEQAQLQAWRAGTTLAIWQAAGRLGADADELLDSTKFLGLLDDLVEADPSKPEFAQAVQAKIQEALERWPGRFTAAGAASGGTAATGPTAPKPDPSQGRGGVNQPVDYRTATSDVVAAELAKHRLRPYAK